MSDTLRLVLLCVVIAALAGIVLTVMLAATASAEQCGCPPTLEPPNTPAPVVTLQPWTARVYLAYIVAAH